MVLRIERRRSPAVAMKMVVMAALQRVCGVVACRGGRGRRYGARRHSEGSRGRRWPRRYGGAAAAALGRVRERGSRGEKQGRGRERGGPGGRGGAEEMTRGVAVARRCRRAGWWRGELGRARRVPPLPTGARRKATGRRRWAGPHSAGPAQELGRLWWAARVRPGRLCSCYFFLLFCFYLIFCHCFEIKQIQKQ